MHHSKTAISFTFSEVEEILYVAWLKFSIPIEICLIVEKICSFVAFLINPIGTVSIFNVEIKIQAQIETERAFESWVFTDFIPISLSIFVIKIFLILNVIIV